MEKVMPKGPKGENRPADVIGCAIAIARISVGETEDDRYSMPGRVRSGKTGGTARAEKLSREERVEIGRKAAAARWQKEVV